MKTGKKGAAGKAFAQGMGFYKLTWIFVICCVLGFAVETAWCYLRFGYIEKQKVIDIRPTERSLWPGRHHPERNTQPISAFL